MKIKNLILFAVALCAAAFASAASLTLRWDDNSTNEKGFYVERAPGEATTEAGANLFKRVSTIPANGTSFLDADVEPGLTYSYRVQAFDNYQVSAYSNIALVTLAPPLKAPGNAVGEQTPLIVVTVHAGGELLVRAGPSTEVKN